MEENLTVLVIGSGAREHTISKAYEKSPQVRKIIVAPGNDFIGYKSQKEVIIDKSCGLKNPQSILEIAKKYKPDLVDVAQDDALAGGTVDLLKEKGFRVFGPTKQASRIEWDKRWSRGFMQRHKIPAPQFEYFDSEEPAKTYVKGLYEQEHSKLLYIKATGLCAGKGALKSRSLEEAVTNIGKMKSFGDSGKIFLVEEGLVGEEFSCYAISDGKNYKILKSAQDNKTVFNFDEGDQTGGMGAISPAMVTAPISKEIEEQLIAKAINGMNKEGVPFVGVLYLGGIVVNGKPMNIEYNARWGDPECQVVLPSIKTDYAEIVLSCLEGRLGKTEIEPDNKTRVCVVGASRGYPNDYKAVKGKRIYGLEKAMAMKGVTVFGAGIDVRDGKFYANGGRLWSIVGEGDNILEARPKAYSAMAHVYIEGNNLHYRTDIGSGDVGKILARF